MCVFSNCYSAVLLGCKGSSRDFPSAETAPTWSAEAVQLPAPTKEEFVFTLSGKQLL